jgi:Na+/H+ antiporter NhaD/arsenite permease-like protein
MVQLMDKIINFFKKEIIFSISLILAIISCFFVQPTINYLNYINWDTILLLLVIMIVVEILKNLSVFEMLVRKLLTKIENARQLVLVLVFTCFLSSIFITNDVSLIIFVPFAILALEKVDRLDLIIFTVSLLCKPCCLPTLLYYITVPPKSHYTDILNDIEILSVTISRFVHSER